jgi:hypothetical protein
MIGSPAVRIAGCSDRRLFADPVTDEGRQLHGAAGLPPTMTE